MKRVRPSGRRLVVASLPATVDTQTTTGDEECKVFGRAVSPSLRRRPQPSTPGRLPVPACSILSSAKLCMIASRPFRGQLRAPINRRLFSRSASFYYLIQKLPDARGIRGHIVRRSSRRSFDIGSCPCSGTCQDEGGERIGDAQDSLSGGGWWVDAAASAIAIDPPGDLNRVHDAFHPKLGRTRRIDRRRAIVVIGGGHR